MTVLPAYYVAPGDVLLVEPVTLESALRFPSDQRVLIDGTIAATGGPELARAVEAQGFESFRMQVA